MATDNALDVLTVAQVMFTCPWDTTHVTYHDRERPGTGGLGRTRCFEHFFREVTFAAYNRKEEDEPQRTILLDFLLTKVTREKLQIVAIYTSSPRPVCSACDMANFFRGHHGQAPQTL